MVAGPAAIEHVRKAKKPLRRRGRGERLPVLLLITGAAEHHHPGHFDFLGKPGGGRRAVRRPGHDHLRPVDTRVVACEKLLPAGIRLLL